MPQSAEHLAALDALGVPHGLLAVTRADLVDAGSRCRCWQGRGGTAREHIAGTGAERGRQRPHRRRVSTSCGAGSPTWSRRLPRPTTPRRPAVGRPVFTRAGAGTVVTGTLAAGRLRVGDELTLSSTGAAVRVRGLQVLGCVAQEVGPVARVAVSLRGPDLQQVVRGRALTAPGRWLTTSVLDVRTTSDGGDLPRRMTLHVGAAAVPATVRPLGAGTVRE